MKTVLKSMLANLLWRSGIIAAAGIFRRVIRGPRLILLCYHRIDANPSLPALRLLPLKSNGYRDDSKSCRWMMFLVI
jgi:hypothetical protein